MSEVMDHHSNSFELFGLDFVIDEHLKCWLIEANMSPACAVRKGQQWLTQMVENMADGMLNIVEHKILLSMMQQKIDFNGPVAEKIKEIKNKQYTVDITNWDLINYNSASQDQKEKRALQKSQTLSEGRQNGSVRNHKNFVQLAKLATTLNHFNPQNLMEQLEVRGRAVELK
jgi:hypothetical protein